MLSVISQMYIFSGKSTQDFQGNVYNVKYQLGLFSNHVLSKPNLNFFTLLK